LKPLTASKLFKTLLKIDIQKQVYRPHIVTADCDHSERKEMFDGEKYKKKAAEGVQLPDSVYILLYTNH
jgi:hypothetical protein